MKYLNNKKILLVICGGIAAYKSLEIIRQLRKNNVTVKTILTKSAEKFVTKLSIVSLSQNKVYDDLFNSENELEMDHISLSRWADLILVVPATANMISKISQGLADDLASTVIMASNKKVMLAPAMNVRMWENPSNKENLNKIIGFGYEVIGPEIGEMACGEFGEGKLTEPSAILSYLNNYFLNISKNKKLKALVTTGPTQENIDPVRYITNHSSGLQGYEIAKSLSENGFETTLISGPTNLKDLPNINIIKIKTAKEMFDKIIKNLPVDVAIFAAAVSDFTFVGQFKEKIKNKEGLQLNLTKTKDILSYVSKHNSLRPKLVIGFSAETHNLDDNSIKKLKYKNCDWIIGNDVSKNDIGFGSEMNAINIYTKENKIERISKNKKSIIAKKIVSKIVNVLN